MIYVDPGSQFVLIYNPSSVQLILTLLMITYGLIGFSDTLSLTQSIGIVGTLILTLYFSKRQIQTLSSDTETRVLNDLGEKFHNMGMLLMEDPSIGRVIENINKYTNQKEVAFSFYVLWMCAICAFEK